jgi:hypothetical protein
VNSGTWRAAVVGGVVGLVCVAGIVVAFVLVGSSTNASRTAAADGPVLVALVLPDANGALALRSLDRYSFSGDTGTITGVDPLTSATVAGTSATTLADAYAFGGGGGLAAAYARSTGGPAPAWIVVDLGSWQKLMGSEGVRLRLATPIEVFDGTNLYSYPAGSISVPAAEIAHVMDGAAYLSPAERKSIRMAVGDALALKLMNGYGSPTAGIVTDLAPEQLRAMFGRVKSPPVRADIQP